MKSAANENCRLSCEIEWFANRGDAPNFYFRSGPVLRLLRWRSAFVTKGTYAVASVE